MSLSERLEPPMKPFLHFVHANEKLAISHDEELEDVDDLTTSVEDDLQFGCSVLRIRIDYLETSEVRSQPKRANEPRARSSLRGRHVEGRARQRPPRCLRGSEGIELRDLERSGCDLTTRVLPPPPRLRAGRGGSGMVCRRGSGTALEAALCRPSNPDPIAPGTLGFLMSTDASWAPARIQQPGRGARAAFHGGLDRAGATSTPGDRREWRPGYRPITG